MKLITIGGKIWTNISKYVSAFWWILWDNYWDDQGIWIDERADEFFNQQS